jgi:outer membrane protein OmpU
MNKLTKAGLTALAGSLAAVSAHAVEMGVSGGVNMTYVSQTGNTGNPFGMESRISFSASGEIENGFGVSYYTTQESHHGAGQYSGELAVDMGDLGRIAFQQGVGNAGIDAIDDNTPKAYEEAWDGLTATQGLVNTGGTNVFKYTNSFGGIGANIAAKRGSDTGNAEGDVSGDGEGSGYSFALTADGETLGVDGMFVGVGYGMVDGGSVGTAGNTKDTEYYAANVNYAFGPVTVGFQRNRVTKATKDVETDMMSIAFNVNDNLAISYADNEVNHLNTGSSGDVSEDVQGIGFSYTMGGMTIAGQQNESDDANGVAGAKDDHTELRLSFAF